MSYKPTGERKRASLLGVGDIISTTGARLRASAIIEHRVMNTINGMRVLIRLKNGDTGRFRLGDMMGVYEDG